MTKGPAELEPLVHPKVVGAEREADLNDFDRIREGEVGGPAGKVDVTFRGGDVV